MSTSTPISNLKINKLTKAQYDSSSKASTELWFVTDELDGQYETMPTAEAKYLNGIVQYTGTSTSSFINGYFYKCVYDGTTYSWEQVNVQPGGGGTGNVESVNGKTGVVVLDGTDINALVGGTTDTVQNHMQSLRTDLGDLADDLDALDTKVDGLIPAQTGQSGKILTTDGTSTSWTDKTSVVFKEW